MTEADLTDSNASLSNLSSSLNLVSATNIDCRNKLHQSKQPLSMVERKESLRAFAAAVPLRYKAWLTKSHRVCYSPFAQGEYELPWL